jgi:hypothetical protein
MFETPDVGRVQDSRYLKLNANCYFTHYFQLSLTKCHITQCYTIHVNQKIIRNNTRLNGWGGKKKKRKKKGSKMIAMT